MSAGVLSRNIYIRLLTLLKDETYLRHVIAVSTVHVRLYGTVALPRWLQYGTSVVPRTQILKDSSMAEVCVELYHQYGKTYEHTFAITCSSCSTRTQRTYVDGSMIKSHRHVCGSVVHGCHLTTYASRSLDAQGPCLPLRNFEGVLPHLKLAQTRARITLIKAT